MASKVFRVPKVVARVYDPRHAELYRRLGLQTVDMVAWGINRIADLLSASQLDTVLNLGSNVNLVEADVPLLLEGRTVKELTAPGEMSVVAISRGAKTFLPTQGTALQAGDILHIAVLSSSVDRLQKLLGLK